MDDGIQVDRGSTITGSIVNQGTIDAEDEGININAHPYAAIRQASKMPGVTIPRHLIGSNGRIYRQLPTFSWSLDSPQGRLLAGAMRRLWRDLPSVPLSDAASVANEFLTLVNGVLDQGFGDQPEPGSALDNSLGLVLRDYLTDNLIRPDLSVEHLVERFQCSRATLYRLFKEASRVFSTSVAMDTSAI